MTLNEIKIKANTLQWAIDVVKRNNKWDAVEEISDLMWAELDKLENYESK